MESDGAEAQGIKVLLVDDDTALRGIAAAHLRKRGAVVELGANGQEGLDRAREIEPDVVVSDIMMPVMDGVQFLKALRQEPALRGAYVILLTAKDKTADMVEGFEATADDYVTKPFKMAELVARVQAGARLKRTQDRLREANARLQEALEQQAKLLGVAMHDIRNPINIITTYVSLLGQDLVSPSDIQEVCLRRAAELGRLVDELLSMSKIEAGLVELSPSEVDLSGVVDEAVELYGPVGQQKGVRITVNCPESLRLYCDETRVLESLTTLLHIMVSLCPEGETVHVAVTEEDETVVLAVSCAGGGFRPEETDAVFEPATDADKVPAGYDLGMMLGLAIVKKLAGVMGGTAWGESAGEGEGATFGFRLPRPAGETLSRAQARYEQRLAVHRRWVTG